MRLILQLVIVAFTVLATSVLQAATLELKNGTLLEGEFVGSSNGIIMFNTGTGIEAFPESKVANIFFGDGKTKSKKKGTAKTITVPKGTRLVIRTSDLIDSSRHRTGHRFRGQLEGALVVRGVTVAPRGSYVHGRITDANQSGRVGGSSNLAVEFTDIMIDHQLFPISTGSMKAQAAPEGGRTVARTARAAAIGGLMGGNSGARTGARVGVGASILSSGASVNIPPGTLLETTLTAPLRVSR
jgi:hypothetical protein